MKVLRERFLRTGPETLYYTPEVHRAAFTLPPSFSSAPAPDRRETSTAQPDAA